MEQEYYIGLDIGTSSVGWAVTDMNYQIIKRHGKALWGSRLFASANTAEERRGFRTARRRLDRRNWRINILQELFAEEISKVDSGFYLRMKESKYYPEDKKDSSGKCPELPYALFVDKDYIAGKEVEISGIDGDFKGSLTAYHDFKEKLTGVELSKKEQEEIILNIVLFGDDKKLLKQRLGKRFPKLTEKQKATLASLSYSGWGRFSKKFLEEITAPAPETGEVWNIITALWESNNNLMQLLSSDYMFMESIEEFNHGKKNITLTYETIENLYVSPAVKREIWQTLKILKEIQKVMGGEPKRVFIEMAREHQESKRTDSRKSWLMDLYKACKKEERDWLEELGQYESHQLRSDKLFLYYTQKGKCMYSGESINLEELWDNTKYDVDHIYPQSKTMDDSINNRVLVKRQYNAKKTDKYPLNSDIQEKMSSYWKMLLDGGFITKEKYERLVRKTELTPNELAGFIERQLVETRQGTKAVAEILKEAMPDTEVVYAKAKNVSEFRHEYGFIKVREMNDLHHIVIGNVKSEVLDSDERLVIL